MKNEKMKVKWTPNLEQDLDAITNKNSPFYDEEVTSILLERFGSIENYKKSDEFLLLKKQFEGIEQPPS